MNQADALDQAVDRMQQYGTFRTSRRISKRLGVPQGGYVRTWIGSLPVYLGMNRRWIPRHTWLFGQAQDLHGRRRLNLPASSGRIAIAKPNLEIVRDKMPTMEEVPND